MIKYFFSPTEGIAHLPSKYCATPGIPQHKSAPSPEIFRSNQTSSLADALRFPFLPTKNGQPEKDCPFTGIVIPYAAIGGGDSFLKDEQPRFRGLVMAMHPAFHKLMH